MLKSSNVMGSSELSKSKNLLKKLVSKEQLFTFIKERYIYILSYLYLFSSIIVFLLGNIKYYISIPLTILLSIALLKAIKNAPKMKVSLLSDKKKVLFVLVIIGVWVIISGVGGFVWQNRWDHKFRNAVFREMVYSKWPVVNGDNALCYYLGFWMVPAVVGKMFGLLAGYIFQTLWAMLGTVLAFGMICQYLKSFKVRNLFIFILFSGLDVILFFIFSKIPFTSTLLEVIRGVHLEQAVPNYQASSITTTLFWVYNQAVPFWVGFMLLLEQKNVKSIVFIYSLLLLFSPFPLVGLAPVMIYLVFRKQDNIQEKNIFKNALLKIKNVCTFENIVSLALFLVVALFFKSNTSANNLSFLKFNGQNLGYFCLHFIFEYGIYLLLLYKYNKHDNILKILVITVICYSFIRLGTGNDFVMRTNIPLVFYLALLVMKQLQRTDVTKTIKILLVIVLCIGAVTPITEHIRSIKNEIELVRKQGVETSRNEDLDTIFDKEKNECYDNFVASRDSIFFKYLAKDNKNDN